jgi:outer membrane lipoprotein carrier protein LolA
VRIGRRALLAGTAVLLGAYPARGDIDDLLVRIARARASMRTLAGPFTQTRTIGLLATQVHSTGALALVRPDRLRWSLAPPDDVTFWVTPEGLAFKSANGQGRMPSGGAHAAVALDDLRTLLAGDLAKLGQRWELRVSHDTADGAEIEATAKIQNAGAMRAFKLALASDLVRPTRVTLVEGPKDKTVIEFGTLTVNGAVDEASMHPPA